MPKPTALMPGTPEFAARRVAGQLRRNWASGEKPTTDQLDARLIEGDTFRSPERREAYVDGVLSRLPQDLGQSKPALKVREAFLEYPQEVQRASAGLEALDAAIGTRNWTAAEQALDETLEILHGYTTRQAFAEAASGLLEDADWLATEPAWSKSLNAACEPSGEPLGAGLAAQPLSASEVKRAARRRDL